VTARLQKVRLKYPAFPGEGKDEAYLACSDGFDPGKPFNIALFFHGFDRSPEQQIERHALVEQMASCRRNTVLVCPRTAVDRTGARNPGAFGDAGHFAGFLGELPEHVATLVEDCDLDRAALVRHAANARLVLAAFSAGHGVASAVLSHPAVGDRLAALAFFDALYRGDDYYKSPDIVLRSGALVGIHGAGYHRAVGGDHHGELAAKLAALGVATAPSLDDVEELQPGTAILECIDVDDHWQVVAEGGRLGRILSKVDVRLPLPLPAPKDRVLE
jgi:hypothetical protein